MSETIEIVRDDFVYKVRIEQDQDAENPRDWYTLAEFVIIGYGGILSSDVSGKAGEALDHFIEQYGYTDSDRIIRAFNKWRVISGDKTHLFIGSGHGYSQGDWREYYALVSGDEYDRDYAESLADDEWNNYITWAFGDVEMYILEGPDGEMIGNCSGHYDRESMKKCYLPEIDHHANDRKREANLVGAGFVGII